MKITIQGQDYTAAFDAARPLTIERKLNEPSVCELCISLPANGGPAAPVRFQSLAVTGDDGTTYFTGYIAVSPLPEYAGMGLEGPRYRLAIQAVSDEILAGPGFDATERGHGGSRRGHVACFAGGSHRIGGSCVAHDFAQHTGGRIYPGAGIELEQKRGSGGKHGSSGISRAEWRGHAFIRAVNRSSAE